jgi:hypothetical protein
VLLSRETPGSHVRCRHAPKTSHPGALLEGNANSGARWLASITTTSLTARCSGHGGRSCRVGRVIPSFPLRSSAGRRAAELRTLGALPRPERDLMSLICESCDQEIPGNRIICPSCNERPSVSAPASSSVDRAYRSAKKFVILSFAVGWFLSPFAFWRAHKAVELYHSSGTDDPEMLRRLHRWRLLAVVLMLAWIALIILEATYFRDAASDSP